MINVLLVSPRLPPSDSRFVGDYAYTETLLKYPPPDVRYYHYEDLIASGQVRKHLWLHRIGYRLRRWGILAPDLWAEYIVSDFVPDILHIVSFSAVVRFPRNTPPVPTVLSMSVGSYSDLRYYLGWPEERVRRARWRKRQYLRLIDAHDSSLRPEKAAHVLVWSEFSKRMHLEEGYVRPDQIEVLYPGLPWRGNTPRKRTNEDGVTFLFVGRDFERKNGPLVLEAFRRVRAQHPEARLIVVSRPADGKPIVEPGVTHYLFLPRQELLDRIYPQADVLVLPSRAEGFGLALLEAMSCNLALIGVNAYAMSEIIQHDRNGYLIWPDSLDDLAEHMRLFAIQPGLLGQMRCESEQIFSEKFAIDVHNRRLRAIYDQVLGGDSM